MFLGAEMRFVLLLQLCLLGLGLSGAMPGRKFLMSFPPHNEPSADVSHQVTITATDVWTSVTVQVLERDYMQHIFLSASQSKTIHLPSSVGMASDHSSFLLSVTSVWPVTAIASLCTNTGCDHSLLHDVASWGTHYYPITPHFPNQTAVSQMVITSADHETSVDVFLSADVLFKGNVYPRGSVLTLHIEVLQSVYLQSNSSLSGSELNSQKAVGVVVGFTCSKHTSGDCLYGFAELRPVSRWSFDYVIPPLINTGTGSSFMLALAAMDSDMDVTTGTGRENVPLVGAVMEAVPIVTSAEIHITSGGPLQLVYFRNDNAQHHSALIVLQSGDDICQRAPMLDSGNMSEQQNNSTDNGDLKSGVKFSPNPNFTQVPDTTEPSSPHTDTDVGYYLSTINRELYSAVCENKPASCEDRHCGHKRKCFVKNGKPICSLKTKICSAWGDAYYRTFDGRDFVLQGNCNYTLVQTTCPGLNPTVPLQINIARAYLNTVSTIHMVQINMQGLNISIVKNDRNHVKINGQKKNLPLTLGNGSLKFYPSGSSVVLDTAFGLSLQYDWKHHLQVEAAPELFGVLCGLCGNANHSSLAGEIASNGTDETQTADFTLPWVVNGDTGTCIEDCGGEVSCADCTQSQTKSFSGIKSSSFVVGCSLLRWNGGPFADCHSYIDSEPFFHSCINNLCVSEVASSMCKILTAFANICQKLGARVQNWRAIAKCSMKCPMNSHYELCGSACPATCGNPEAHHNCTLPCVESCQCNRGYLLSGGKCVPQGNCGCLHQGSYYLPKESFWTDEQCQEECVCQPASKSVMCAPSNCRDGQVCKLLDGVPGCHAGGPGMCVAKGDPHYTTFDGRNFDVYGNCTYLLTSHCPSWGDLQDFSVEVQNQIKDATNISFRHVQMAVSGYSIEMSDDWPNRVMVNGLLLRLPSVLSRGKVKLYMSGISKCVETDFGVVLTHSSDVLTVQMPRSFSGNLCGLCGNFNDDPEDDLMPDDDDSDAAQAVRHWKIVSERDCVDEPVNTLTCSSQDMALYQGKDFCGRLLDTEGAFQSCHKTADPQDFYDNCVHDLCYNNQTSLCLILSSYVSVCQEMGAIVDEWRASNFCNLSCRPNSEYRLCSSHTSDCAENSKPSAVKCKEGCFCKPGFFHSAGECVPVSECGCIYNGVYHEIHENFYPDEHCRQHCVCVSHNTVQCRNHTCPNGTKCAIQDGLRVCRAPQPLKCEVMGGRHFRTYNGHNFDFSMGSCRYILSQGCDEEESDPTVTIQRGQLHLSVHGVNISLDMEHLGKVKIDGVLWGLPVQLEHAAILRSGSLTRVVIDTGAVVTYGGPNLIQIALPASHRTMCGLCGNISAADAGDKRGRNGSRDSDVSLLASSWSLSPPGTNCSEDCDLCSACNSSMAAELASANLCGKLLAPSGSFSGCHSTVDPEPFFQRCLRDMCVSDGNEDLFCSRLMEYTFACQEAGARVTPWRDEKCLLSCPENSHYNICVSACPESCGILSDIPCPWGCYEGCQCDSGYMQSGNGCIKAEKCGCFYRGHYYDIGETSWAEGCSERCNCSATAIMCCEPASCPEGESCTLNNTWCCAQRVDNETCETCGVQSQLVQTQCWVLGGAHYYTFDGKVFEFQGNCTYTLVHTVDDTSENNTFWVGVQKDRTPNETSSVKAVLVKVANLNITIYREGRDSVWINGKKRLLPLALQFGHVKIYQSGTFVVVDTNLGLQVKYDCSHIATVLLSNATAVQGICGNNNGIEEDDLRTPQGEAVDATTFGWSWRVPNQEAQCTADCGDACPRCSAAQLQEKKVARQWISIHEYIWSPQNPFHHCREVVDYDKISTAVSVFDLCSGDDSQEALCLILEAYAAACQSARVQIGEWRNSTFCSMLCPLNSRYTSCGSACPATCQDPFSSSPCTLACVETCQCDPGFVLDGDTCVPLSQCGCTHNGFHYHRNQTFWADDGCGTRCVCDPHTHEAQCGSDSCGPDAYCGLQGGVRSCLQHPQLTCTYTSNRVVTFDQHSYDFHGTCQYQLVGMCGQKRGLNAVQVYVRTDGHLESALHVLVNVSGVQVKLNSNNTETIEVDGVRRSMPHHVSSAALALSLGLHTYIFTDFGFKFSLSKEGIVSISLSSKYINATCGLCGNFNSDPADDLTANGTLQPLSPERFGKAWRSGQSPWCMEGCQGGSCPKCSSERLAHFSDPEACGKILEVNGPFRHCHGKVDPSSFYKHCVSDLCLHGGLQPALCRSLAHYTAVCLSHKATVYAWRSPGFCYASCPTSTGYSTSPASVHLCLGWQNDTLEMPANVGENCLCEAGLVHSGSLCVSPENCGCFHHGEYLRAGQEVSTCEQSCSCHAGGHVTCRNVSCAEDEECKLIRGVQGCHPKPKAARCSVHGSQYTTFDGQAFEFHGSCNYTLVQTCSLKLDVEPILIAAQGNHGNGEGRQIYLQVSKMYFRITSAFPGRVQVNGVYENLPFSWKNFSIHQNNGRISIKTPQSVELISDLKHHIAVKIPDIYQQTTCGLCGNYNGDPSDDMQLPNGTVISDPDIFGPSWKLPDTDSSCSDACDSTCQLCRSPVPVHTSDLYCGLLTHPRGPFSSCQRLVCPKKYYSLCLKNLCAAEGQRWALCDALWAYEAACKEAGGTVDLWMNTTGCALQCPKFSHYSHCANVCSSLCPEISWDVQCPRDCEEGCQCNSGHLYDGHGCVPAERCGCAQDGRRFKPSESKLLQNCTVNCTCGPPLVCEQYSCPPQHSCTVSDGIMVCDNDDPCGGKCDETEKCSLSNGLPFCESHRGLCWVWGGRHYHTFDGFNYNFNSTCTYLLAASKGTACGRPPFSVSNKNGCDGTGDASSKQVITVQAYGFVIKLSEKGNIHVNGQVTYTPVDLLRGKIQVSYKENKAILKTDFGMHVVFDGNSTLVVTLEPQYKGNVYGLCGNFNGDPQDERPVATPGSPPNETSAAFAQAYRLFDGDHNCTACVKKRDEVPMLAADAPASNHWRRCAELRNPSGLMADCHSLVPPDSFYESCISDCIYSGESEGAALDQAMQSYSVVCNESDIPHREVDVQCPLNSHYKTCGSACPPTCEVKPTVCNMACVQGCFCDPGFIMSPAGCVYPHQCGCTDSRGKYHSLNSTFWAPEDCGQLCTCGPAPGEVHCRPDQCPKGTVCKQLHHKRLCQPEKPLNCTIVTGMHFTTFDGHHFDFRDSCEYSLVQTKSNLTGLTPFNITISDASCHKMAYHSLTLTVLIYGLEVVVKKDEPGKVWFDGLHKHLPYSHPAGHVDAYRTPSSLVIHTDVGLQVVVYNMGTLMVLLPSTYGVFVSGLCGNANADPADDQMMPDEELAQNKLEFAHSWRSQRAEACRPNCVSRPKKCSVQTQKLFEGSDFCGVLLNELGPFADCASVLSPKDYFHSCVADSCAYDGHYTALCNAIASYAAACQAAQLPVRHWRSDTFCGMSCPKNSHYELCGPRCPPACRGPSSPLNCSRGCEEGCQCDPGYVQSDGQCVPLSDCGCVHEGQYQPAGQFHSEKSCQTCNCDEGKVTCGPMERCNGSPRYGVCQVFAGFGYITFDGVVLPHHGACTYLLSAFSSKAVHDYVLLLSFKEDGNGTFTISRLVFQLFSLEVSVDPETLWKLQVNGEERRVPFDNGKLKAYQAGHRLIITTPSGVEIDLSSTQYLRLTVPLVYDSAASGLCGNFNGDRSDDLQMRNLRLAMGFGEFLRSWAEVSPGQLCADTCGKECDECRPSPRDAMVCDILLMTSAEFNQCRNSEVDRDIYMRMCLRAVCAGARHMAACLALEAYSAACRAKGIPVGPWRKDTPCALQCPDRSSPGSCVDSSSNSCPALLQPGSSATGCSEACQCHHGNVFDVGECVPYSRCGCVFHGIYIKMDEELYTEGCSRRCWCHPLSGVMCEEAGCGPGRRCALRSGSWGCHDKPDTCELRDSLRVSTLSGEQLILKPRLSYSLMSLCDNASEQWFSVISYHGPCEGGSSRLVTVFQILLRGSSLAVRDGTVKVNGHLVSLPHLLPSGVSLTSGMNQDKSEVTVILRRDAGTESELELEIGVTMVTVKVPLWYSGKLCGLCGNLNDLPSHSSVRSWVLADFPGCGFTG